MLLQPRPLVPVCPILEASVGCPEEPALARGPPSSSYFLRRSRRTYLRKDPARMCESGFPVCKGKMPFS